MIYEALAQLLGELFVDVEERHVAFSLGDLFEASHFRLQDVFLKTETFNMLHLPLALAAGYVGDLKVEGLVGAVAGAPLSLRVRNVCLVLRHAQVPHDSELLLRFAKEFVIALWQSVLVPSFEGKPTASSSSSAFISPGKWIASRVQAAIADMTVTMENIHVRVESENDDAVVAYGLYIPVLRVNTRATDDQILHRRQQTGVEYPKASGTASKLLALENPALYCDVGAERYWFDPLRPSSTDNSLLRLRECALRGLPRDARRDICSATAVWIKMDLQRRRAPVAGDSATAAGGGGGLTLAAVDIVTEGLRVDVDLDQLAALTTEMDRVKEFRTRYKMQQWRPSGVDRALMPPPIASVRHDALFPALPADMAALLAPRTEAKRSPQWLRALWQYAARCVLLQLRKGNARRVRLFSESGGKRQSHYERQKERNARRDRYMHLYTRSLSPSALKLVLRGRAALVAAIRSPRRAEAPSSASPGSPMASQDAVALPELPPLALAEQWELSDLVWELPVYDQRVYRAMADHALRREYGRLSVPSSPIRKLSLGGVSSPVAAATTGAGAVLPPSPLDSSTFPPDFVANHHRRTRSATESSVVIASPASSPPLARVHAASTSVLLGRPLRDESASPTASPTYKTSPPHAPISKQEWFQQTFFPAWVTGKRALPLVNWSLGAISMTLCRPATSLSARQFASPVGASRSASAHLPEVVDDVVYHDEAGVSRSPRDVLVDVRVESCSGAALVTKTPTIRALVELRVGLVRATLLDQRPKKRPSIRRRLSSDGAAETEPPPPPPVGGRRRKWISTDYIREPADGFFYLGLKYNAKEPPGIAPAALQACDAEEWDVKARVCVGTVNVEYHEGLAGATHSSSAAGEPPTRASVLHDVYCSCAELLKRRAAKQRVSERPDASAERGGLELDDTVKQPDQAAATLAPVRRLSFVEAVEKWSEAKRRRVLREAKRSRFLNALMLHALTLEADLGAVQLSVSVPTSDFQSALCYNDSARVSATGSGTEELSVELAPTTLKLENRPLLDECVVEGAGVRAVYRSTKHGRAAAVHFLSHRLGRR